MRNDYHYKSQVFTSKEWKRGMIPSKLLQSRTFFTLLKEGK